MGSSKNKKASEDLMSTWLDDLKSEPKAAPDATSILSSPAEEPQQEPPADGTQVVQKNKNFEDPKTKTSFGAARPSSRSGGAWQNATDGQLLQSENLRLAQRRISELEKEVEKLREENEVLASASEFAKGQVEDLQNKVMQVERARSEQAQTYLAEISMLKEAQRESEKTRGRLKAKVEELQGRLHADLKRIRVRERELENRLELSKLEKTALLKSKDDNLLELKAKLDEKTMDLQLVQRKNKELLAEINRQNEQFVRTVRALRLALTNLEAMEKTDVTDNVTVAPIKKAE